MYYTLCFKSEVRKFLAGLIVETPLIVLQYYKKPSFSLYIYIYIHKGPLYKEEGFSYIKKDL
jgi:hypothetical protein